GRALSPGCPTAGTSTDMMCHPPRSRQQAGVPSREACDVSAAAPPIVTRSRWPWVLVAVYLLILPVTLWLTGVNGRSWLESLPGIIAFTAFGVLGASILSEQRDNVIGLLLISSPLVLSVGAICGEIATWLIRTDGSSS